MARPNKQGVDYFPLDVHLDDKFKFIEIKYKLEGFAILIKLMQKIYSYGYWYRWTDDEALLFADELRTDFETVKGVVNESLERGVFDKGLYEEYNILTSKGIQKRYKEIVRRRKDVEVIEEYLLIDNSFGVNDDINTSEGQRNDSKSTQSKVKESKVNKTKEKKQKFIDHVLLTNAEYENLITDFGQKNIDSKIEDLDTYISNKKKDPYKDHNKTIRNWLKRDGIKKQEEKKNERKTAEQIEHERMLAEMGD